MNNTQLYLSIGIPSFLVVLAWLSNRADIQKMGERIDQVRQEVVMLRRDMQADLSKGLDGVRGEMIAFRREIHAYMVSLHERVAVVEARVEKK